MSEDDPLFLDVEDVLEIHAMQLEVHGGGAGLRDLGLLESAVAQPQTWLGGGFAHEGPFAMAAAYLFHIVRNHPFVDGNKRAGMLAAVVFLDLNGIMPRPADGRPLRADHGRRGRPSGQGRRCGGTEAYRRGLGAVPSSRVKHGVAGL